MYYPGQVFHAVIGVAPLKPVFTPVISHVQSIVFHAVIGVAPLKLVGPHQEVHRLFAVFHADIGVAPLKLAVRSFVPPSNLVFHAEIGVAPLKRCSVAAAVGGCCPSSTLSSAWPH